MRLKTFFTALLLVASLSVNSVSQSGDRVSIRVDATKIKGEMKPIWSFFGYDEPNYTYMKDGKKLLSELAALSHMPVYVRTHNRSPPAMERRRSSGVRPTRTLKIHPGVLTMTGPSSIESWTPLSNAK